MAENQPNISPEKKSGAPKKRPPRKLPFYRRVYRAVYTFFYVAAQLIRECALFLFEKAKELGITARELFFALVDRLDEANKQRKNEKQRKVEKKESALHSDKIQEAEKVESVDSQARAAAVGKQPKKAENKKRSFFARFSSSFGEKKQRQYAEKDFLDFEEEREGGKAKKKNKKKKELPTFDEVLLYKEERQKKREQWAKNALIRFLAVVLGVQILALAFCGGLYVYTGNPFTFGSMEVHLKEGKQTVTYSVSIKTGYTEKGSPKVDMNALASFLALEMVSDRNYVYYTLTDGKRIVLIKNSKTALLDESRITLSEEVDFVGKRVYVPIELITDYTEGIGVSYSEKENRLTLTRQKDELLSNSRETVYKEWRLLVSAIEKAPLPQMEQSENG